MALELHSLVDELSAAWGMADATMGASAGHITLALPATAAAAAGGGGGGGGGKTSEAAAAGAAAAAGGGGAAGTRMSRKRKGSADKLEGDGSGRDAKRGVGVAGASGSGAIKQQQQQQYVKALDAYKLNEVPLLSCGRSKHYFRELALNPNAKSSARNSYGGYGSDGDDYDDDYGGGYGGYGGYGGGYGGKRGGGRGGGGSGRGGGGSLAAAAAGGGELMRRRLRRITEELATLATSLPVTWDSSILLAVDEERVDVLRALLLPAGDTPYAHGAFEFDILLPQDYPNSPPKVRLICFLCKERPLHSPLGRAKWSRTPTRF